MWGSDSTANRVFPSIMSEGNKVMTFSEQNDVPQDKRSYSLDANTWKYELTEGLKDRGCEVLTPFRLFLQR